MFECVDMPQTRPFSPPFKPFIPQSTPKFYFCQIKSPFKAYTNANLKPSPYQKIQPSLFNPEQDKVFFIPTTYHKSSQNAH
jgi:hypothetical protein